MLMVISPSIIVYVLPEGRIVLGGLFGVFFPGYFVVNYWSRFVSLLRRNTNQPLSSNVLFNHKHTYNNTDKH